MGIVGAVQPLTFAAMKKLTCIAIAAFLSLSCLAQLEIEKKEINKPLSVYKRLGGEWIADLNRHITPSGDTMYAIYFNDNEYSRIINTKGFAFVGINDMKEFFALIKTIYRTPKKEKDMEYIIPTVGGDVTVRWSNNQVLLLVKDQYGSYSSFRMGEKVLDKLNVL